MDIGKHWKPYRCHHEAKKLWNNNLSFIISNFSSWGGRQDKWFSEQICVLLQTKKRWIYSFISLVQTGIQARNFPSVCSWRLLICDYETQKKKEAPWSSTNISWRHVWYTRLLNYMDGFDISPMECRKEKNLPSHLVNLHTAPCAEELAWMQNKT